MTFSRHFNFANLKWPYFATVGNCKIVVTQFSYWRFHKKYRDLLRVFVSNIDLFISICLKKTMKLTRPTVYGILLEFQSLVFIRE